MEAGWKCCFTTHDDYVLSIATDLLNGNSIKNVVINHKDSAYIYMGDYEIFVKDEDLEIVDQIFEQFKKNIN